jgi:molybdopterin converting factor small subunit
MKKLLLVLFFVSCSPSLGNQVLETTTSTALVELTLCEKVEKEYISLSNELFVTSFELNDYINNLSDALVEDDRVVFFEDMGDNFDHQNIYKNYLETRAYVYEEINRLYKTNKECPIAGDQEIADEKVLEAKKELSEFLNNY